ncbi:UTP-glucose-1-phosphate uridylyltransferase (macronuclear) [Tetrahymena thermophila SB210]|uniref:UDP-N-acetylglucosamine diphosphorylase n=1 Tax=Tetrahymena thermophila (strain SB210) TaxID=312017 RepID=Q22AN7_TETTS|nr:UTP-glucose-1-phosphate uridylyltransferase [Tetrahymena thermophila SB210]EAR82357.2 UTP-glucose-1-phosphate uridylyltransferase [Tetrahymena thermophila SB210]|eukprot:XP_001030020.2 UTP-glucose-1-phosphate uridylyltransferase [Tetrahymena thermophila SB210]
MGQNICGAMNGQNQQQISNMQEISELDFNRNSTYKKLEQYSYTVCKEKDISPVFNIMIQRLLSMGQYDLFNHISKLSTQEQKNEYLRYLDSISHEMEVVDSLYHHFIKQSNQLAEEINDDLDIDVIKHVDNVLNIEDIPYGDYERLYSTGLKLIRQKQVALVIMAGGRNLRYDKDLVKSSTDIGLPSSQCIMELIGRKLWTLKEIAFANSANQQSSSFQIYIVVNYQNSSLIKNIWQKSNYFGFNEYDVTFIFQNSYPITDMQGKLILKNDTQCHLFPCGTGDVVLQLIHNRHLNKLVEKGYRYIHFIGVENLLVKPLDPLFIGIASENRKAINQKIVQVDRNESEFYRIANINGRASLLEFDSIKKLLKQKMVNNKSQIPKDIDDAPAFLFNTLISINFLVEFSHRVDLKQAFESKFRVMKRCLQLTQETPQENLVQQQNGENNILIFEKQIGDIIELTDDINFVMVHEAEEFAPIIFNKGVYSPQDAIQKLSNLHKRWLKFEINETRESDIIEVCPQISYAGEGLDICAEYLRHNWQNQQFPLYINFKKAIQFETTQNNENHHAVNNSHFNHSIQFQNEDKKYDNPSLYHSIDGHAMNGADQSFTQRKEIDLIYKSYNNLGSGNSNMQIPISQKNIQNQIILEEPYKINGNPMIRSSNNANQNLNNHNGKHRKFSLNDNKYLDQNNGFQDNKVVKPTNQIKI